MVGFVVVVTLPKSILQMPVISKILIGRLLPGGDTKMVRQTRDVYVRPKRRIEKSLSIIQRNVSVAETGMVVFAADDRMTLVRTIIDLKLDIVGDDASFQVAAVLCIAPDGVEIMTASTAEDLSREIPLQYIHSILFGHDLSLNAHYVFDWKFDSKGMRKLQKGDHIRISTKAETANMFMLSGTILFIFKE